MNKDEYLQKVLAAQKLANNSDEMVELRKHKEAVETLLSDNLSASSPTIRYGGSKAKGTLISEDYDLDIICYFSHNDTETGETLKEIYHAVKSALLEKYHVENKNSALRLKSADTSDLDKDFHIDVVPGRYTDESETDCFLHQELNDKERLKTNLDIHIHHVRTSEVLDALRLLKLWRIRKAMNVKQFVFELLCIKLLDKQKKLPLADQVQYVWEKIVASSDPIKVEDPANPEGNDLMPILSESWEELRSVANETLMQVEDSGWESVFGSSEKPEKTALLSGLAAAASAAPRSTQPWGPA